MITAIFTTAIALGLLLLYLRRRPKCYPPGPYPLPIVGNMFQVGTEPHKYFMELRKKYGDVVSVDLGSMKAIVIHDHTIYKEAYNNAAVAGRPQSMHFDDPETKSPQGVAVPEGSQWSEQRRFVLKTLRDFGFGKQSLEPLIHEEIKELINGFLKDEGKSINTDERFNIAVYNVLWTMIAGERVSQNEENMKTLINHLVSNSKDKNTFGLMLFFPWLFKMVPRLFGYNTYMSNVQPVYEFIKKVVIAHKNTCQVENPRDLLDCYLRQIQETTDKNSSFYKTSGDHNMRMVVYDLFMAGTVTTSTTLTWTFLLLAHNPKIQEKLHEEIKQTIGESRLPSLTDRPNMPYAEAVMLEVMRYSSLVAATYRRTVADTVIGGYRIPKHTIVIGNLYAIHYDPKIWGDGENFRPERFLSEDGKKAIRHEALLPFGSGKRVCLGETLARDQQFLFTTSLFQRLKVKLDPKDTNPKIEVYTEVPMLLPKPHYIIVEDRYNS